ncbi:MAG: RES family NAD+ phosphorylase [Candidatus Baltobacteraceae bacterium]
MTVNAFDARLVRLAFPLRSLELDTLVERHELNALEGLRSITTPLAEKSVNAYVPRPFAFPSQSRFSDGTFGVLYAGNSLATAVRETGHHLTRIYADGNAPPMETRRVRLALYMRGSAIVDIRHATDPAIAPAIDSPETYSAIQRRAL